MINAPQYNSVIILEESNFSQDEEEFQRELADQILKDRERIENQERRVLFAKRKYDEWERTASSHRKEGVKPDKHSYAAFSNAEKYKKRWLNEVQELNRLTISKS